MIPEALAQGCDTLVSIGGINRIRRGRSPPWRRTSG